MSYLNEEHIIILRFFFSSLINNFKPIFLRRSNQFGTGSGTGFNESSFVLPISRFCFFEVSLS